ncbi:rhoptry protein ROP15 [Toxoplasma gondii RUB]|uniref:Rhoptry protein ROP15 n=1 Tax=Toxoplasma gondii RUB TaxID=935652 RepID=A0A086LMJ4_TOXGO|nr:rhoptry protein ROP15 [Toxoplasma gondii RUB]
MLKTTPAFFLFLTWMFPRCDGFVLTHKNGTTDAYDSAVLSFLLTTEGVREGAAKSSGTEIPSTLACPSSSPLKTAKDKHDASLLGLVSSVPDSGILKPEFVGAGAALVAVTRSVKWTQLKQSLKALVDTGVKCKVNCKHNNKKLSKNTDFKDQQEFPQTSARILPTSDREPLLAGPQKVTEEDLQVLLFEIAHDCKMSAPQAAITKPLTILLAGIPGAHLSKRPFEAAIPHFILQKEDTVDLLLTVDRSWCGKGLSHLVRYHVGYMSFNLEVNGRRLADDDTFEDDRLYRQVVLTTKFTAKSLGGTLKRVRSLTDIHKKTGKHGENRPHSSPF